MLLRAGLGLCDLMPKISFLLKQRWFRKGQENTGFKALGESLSREVYNEVGLKYLSLAVNRWRMILASRLTRSLSTTLHKRSGQLMEAVEVIPKVRDSDLIDVSVYIDESKAPYAMAHEEGATITASSGFLTIPTPFIRERVSAAKKRDRYWASKMLDDMIEQGKVFVVPRHAAQTKVVMLRRAGGRVRNSGAIPVFVLKKQVVVPRRPWLSTGVAEAIEEFPRVMEGIQRQYFGGKGQ